MNSLYNLNGLTITNLDTEEAAKLILQPINESKGKTVHTINADHLDKLLNLNNQEFRNAYKKCDLITLDSRILKSLIKIRFRQSLKVCTGSDLTEAIFRKASLHPHLNLCVIGGDNEALEILRNKYKLPNRIDQYIPPMGFINNPDEFRKTLSFINLNRYDIVFLAVGCPQQEILAAYLKENANTASYFLCIGASIDFLTGKQQRAPKLIQRLHLEWGHRLLQNPKRMTRRYLSNLKVLPKIKFDRK